MDALPGYGGAVEKVGHRRFLVISVACVAAAVKLDLARGRFVDVLPAFGGVGSIATRFASAEARLNSAPITADFIAAVAEDAAEPVRSRSRQSYRRRILKGFVARALLNAIRDAGARLDVLVPTMEAEYA